MLTRPETAGTTLEILAPYLPYGIEMRSKLASSRIKGKLLAAGVTRKKPHMPWLEYASVEGRDYAEMLRDLKPVLYGWDSLAKNTEEHGVLLLKLAMNLGWHAMGPFGVEHDHAWVYDHCERATSPVYLLRRKDFEQGLFTAAERRACLGLHLAIGLEPHQYIEKSSPAPTVDKEPGGRGV